MWAVLERGDASNVPLDDIVLFLVSTDTVVDTQKQSSDPAFVRLRNPSTGLT